eukprot:286513_1
MRTIMDKVYAYYRIAQLKNRITTAWTDFTGRRTEYHLKKWIEAMWELGAISLLIGYGIFSAFNVFSSPWIVLGVMYDTLNMHQTCFLVLYVLVMSIALWKLYQMANYERMMWYILPDLSTS